MEADNPLFAKGSSLPRDYFLSASMFVSQSIMENIYGYRNLLGEVMVGPLCPLQGKGSRVAPSILSNPHSHHGRIDVSVLVLIPICFASTVSIPSGPNTPSYCIGKAHNMEQTSQWLRSCTENRSKVLEEYHGIMIEVPKSHKKESQRICIWDFLCSILYIVLFGPTTLPRESWVWFWPLHVSRFSVRRRAIHGDLPPPAVPAAGRSGCR